MRFADFPEKHPRRAEMTAERLDAICREAGIKIRGIRRGGLEEVAAEIDEAIEHLVDCARRYAREVESARNDGIGRLNEIVRKAQNLKFHLGSVALSAQSSTQLKKVIRAADCMQIAIGSPAKFPGLDAEVQPHFAVSPKAPTVAPACAELFASHLEGPPKLSGQMQYDPFRARGVRPGTRAGIASRELIRLDELLAKLSGEARALLETRLSRKADLEVALTGSERGEFDDLLSTVLSEAELHIRTKSESHSTNHKIASKLEAEIAPFLIHMLVVFGRLTGTTRRQTSSPEGNELGGPAPKFIAKVCEAIAIDIHRYREQRGVDHPAQLAKIAARLEHYQNPHFVGLFIRDHVSKGSGHGKTGRPPKKGRRT